MPFWRRLEQAIALTWAQLDSNWNYLDRPAAVVLPIVSGIITITGPGLYKIETEGGAGTDDLTGITGGSGREWPVILTLNTAGRVITVKNTPPNFLLAGPDFLLNGINDSICFRDRTSSHLA